MTRTPLLEALNGDAFPFPGLLDEYFDLDKDLSDDPDAEDEDEIPEESPGIRTPLAA